MENKQTLEFNNSSFTNAKAVFPSNKEDQEMDFSHAFDFDQKPTMNYFSTIELREKYENPMLEDEFSNKFLAQRMDNQFNFGPLQLGDVENELYDPFNFFSGIQISEPARSHKEPELTFDCEFTPRVCKSADLKTINETVKDMKIAILPKKQTQIKEETDQKEIRENLVDSSYKICEEKKSSSSSSPVSVDPAKLQKLMKYLSKTKGVDKTQIDEEIVSRTVEFGQQKVAESLNIPYRRYKSILNKVGIKTWAGRKVNNLQFESQLVDWASEMKNSGDVLTRKMIKDKAGEIINELIEQGEKSLKKVRLSKGWLDKFVKRHENIREYLTSQKGKKLQ